jgi:hypothetical protein
MSDQLDMPTSTTPAPKRTDTPAGPELPQVPQQRAPEWSPQAAPAGPMPPMPGDSAAGPPHTDPPQRSRRRLGWLIGAVVALVVVLAGATATTIYLLTPTPTEHLADVVRAVSGDASTFKHASDDTIANSVSKVCTSGALFGLRPGPMIWTKIAEGNGTHPEAVSREEFVNAVDDFCASER